MVFEIMDLTQQYVQITGLIDVKLDGIERPKTMIHPDAGNLVAICYEFSRGAADDGGIAAIQANAG